MAMQSTLGLMMGLEKPSEDAGERGGSADAGASLRDRLPFCGEPSYYANQYVFCDLKPGDIPQPAGEVYMDDV